MEQLSLFPLEDKINRAIENIKMFEEVALRMDPEGYYLAFSGGKDSQVIFQLAKMAGVKFTAHYHITTVDPPELVQFIRKEYPEVLMERPGMSMWQLIVKKGFPPTRRVRYCCSELKERGGEGRFVMTGVRWAESKKRCKRGLAEVSGKKSANVILLNNDNDEKRRLIENCQIKGKRILNPIIDWTDSEVWSFIHQYVHKYCKLYDCGFTRLGCIGCPLASIRKRERELARYPKYKEAYLRAFGRMLKERELDHTKGAMWKNAEDVYRWWLYGNEKREEPVPGQLSLDLKQERRMVVDVEIKVEGKSLQEWEMLYRQYIDQWQRVHDYGDGDKMWADGITLNQIRRELLKVQGILSSMGEETSVPPEMAENYMADAQGIRKRAAGSLEKYLQSEDYKYLLRMAGCLTDTQQRKSQISWALGSVGNLEQAVRQDDLVVMREFGAEGQFERMLADTAERVRKLQQARPKAKAKEKPGSKENEDWQIEGQMSIFDLAS